MIDFDAVTITYAGARAPVLHDVDLHVPEGEMALVVGRTGSGKSTLLRAVNGLVPHFSGGTLAGRVRVAGRDTRDNPPRELADVVGYVGQDPRAGFVTDVVEDELAYAMESIGVPPDVMRRRVEETLDLLGLVAVRDRPLMTLSAGQCQRVAIGSVLAAGPRVLVLDEPTSALDPPAAEEVLAALTRLVHDLGLTVLVAEHRLERVVQYADRVVAVGGPDGTQGTVTDGPPAEMMRTAPVAPPVVELGRVAGWSPLPLSVRDARRLAAPPHTRDGAEPPSAQDPPLRRPVVRVERLVARYAGNDPPALRDVDLAVATGEIVAVMGRNGAGKSTLLAQLAGLRTPAAGRVTVLGRAPHEVPARDLPGLAALVPSDPADLLYHETVADECADAGPSAGPLLERLATGIGSDLHPRDLSEGQRLALTLAVMLAAEPPLLLLDEPTRGLDYPAKRRLIAVLRERAAAGTAVILATHDVELAAEVATRTIVLADGEVVTDGPTARVVTASPAFAPQVAKVFAPLPVLTMEQAVAAVTGSSR